MSEQISEQVIENIVWGKIRNQGTNNEDSFEEIIEEPFPYARLYHWKPKDSYNDKDFPFPIIITQEVLAAVNFHVNRTLEKELGGFLLGNLYRCPNTQIEYIVIDQIAEAKHTKASEVLLTFTGDSWAELSDGLSGKFRGKSKIGWYHSHPRMDIFLSNYDIEIQQNCFPAPWMVALVVEPEKGYGGFFCWKKGNVDPRNPVDFYEYLERDSKESRMTWSHYSCVDAKNGQPITPAIKQAKGISQQQIVSKQDYPKNNTASTNTIDSTQNIKLNNKLGVMLPLIIILLSVSTLISSIYLIKTINQKPQPTQSTQPIEVEKASLKAKILYYQIKDNQFNAVFMLDNPSENLQIKINDKLANISKQEDKFIATMDFSDQITAIKQDPLIVYFVNIEIIDDKRLVLSGLISVALSQEKFKQLFEEDNSEKNITEKQKKSDDKKKKNSK